MSALGAYGEVRVDCCHNTGAEEEHRVGFTREGKDTLLAPDGRWRDIDAPHILNPEARTFKGFLRGSRWATSRTYCTPS